jgi:hypothetical protein
VIYNPEHFIGCMSTLADRFEEFDKVEIWINVEDGRLTMCHHAVWFLFQGDKRGTASNTSSSQ